LDTELGIRKTNKLFENIVRFRYLGIMNQNYIRDEIKNRVDGM
jgi:hypothetical protein